MFWNHVNKQLSAYCHGELSPAESRRVAEHLTNCRRCRDEYEEIKFGVALMEKLACEQAPAELWNELDAAMEEKAALPVHSRGVALSDKLPACRRLSQLATWLEIGFYRRQRQAGSLSDRQGAEAARRRPFRAALSFKLSAAVAVLLMVGLGVFWFQSSKTPRPFWEVTRIEGQPVVGSKAIGDAGRLSLGEWLTTDDASRAQIDVGQIGLVTVEPNSRLKLAEARNDEHRLAMTRGKMSALIWAPPRQFYVDTPSAVAVDLGCAYTLEVNDDGQAVLAVTAGWVAFESEGRESFVPRDGMCVTRPGLGPGTPYFNDASDEFKQALAKFDTSGMDWSARGAALGIILYQARERDALTLWHLLSRTAGEERGLVYDKLASFVPPPVGVTREGVLSRDKKMLDLWWENLGLGSADFWRIWKGPVPK
ncbi:MAG: zf-HC2 domain-containing protein [Blastocatellales bacterium]